LRKDSKKAESKFESPFNTPLHSRLQTEEIMLGPHKQLCENICNFVSRITTLHNNLCCIDKTLYVMIMNVDVLGFSMKRWFLAIVIT